MKIKEGWKNKKFSDVFDLQMGKTPARQNSVYWQNGTHSWVSISDMKEDKYIKNTKEKISDIALQETGIKKVPAGTVIMSFKLSIGKTAITQTDLYTNEAIMAFHVKNEYNIDANFLYYYLCGYTWSDANKAVMGVTLNKTTISNHKISIPPLPIQNNIVAELDALNDIINIKKQQLEELDKLAEATFYDMFGDPVENEKGWEVKKLGDNVNEMHLGPFGSSLKKEFFVSEDKAYCMVYEQKHAIRKTLNLETRFVEENKYKELKRFEVKPGDFLMSCRGTIGEIFRLPKDAPKGIIHPSLMKIRIQEEKYNPIFFEKIFYTIVKNEDVQGAAVKMAITAKSLGAKELIIPPLSLQTQFAKKIEHIENQKSLIQGSIDDVQQLLDYTMDKYFS